MLTTTKSKTKLSKAELYVLYDRIYDIADRLFKKYNPCNIYTKNGIVYCTDYPRKIYNKHSQKCGHFLCCGRCKNQSISGCTIKCLPCKLFLCFPLHSKRKYKHFKNKLVKLKNIAGKHGIYSDIYYHTKSEVLNISEKKRETGYEAY